MAGEKGARDIMELCMFLWSRGRSVRWGSAPCAPSSATAPNPWSRGPGGRWSGDCTTWPVWGWRTTATRSSPCTPPRLFPFQEVRAEMACIQGRGPKGKANLKRFLDGMLVLVEED